MPFRDQFIICPSCGEALVAGNMFGGSEVLRCEVCLGIFMSHSTVAEFTSTLQGVAIMNRRITNATKVIDSDGRICPQCQRSMFVAHVGAVSVDICEDHGVWFDASELSQLSVMDAN